MFTAFSLGAVEPDLPPDPPIEQMQVDPQGDVVPRGNLRGFVTPSPQRHKRKRTVPGTPRVNEDYHELRGVKRKLDLDPSTSKKPRPTIDDFTEEEIQIFNGEGPRSYGLNYLWKSKYFGPGNSMNLGAPKSWLEYYAFKHDLAYQKLQQQNINPYVPGPEVSEIDDEFLTNIKDIKGYRAKVARAIFTTKKKVNKLGKKFTKKFYDEALKRMKQLRLSK